MKTKFSLTIALVVSFVLTSCDSGFVSSTEEVSPTAFSYELNQSDVTVRSSTSITKTYKLYKKVDNDHLYSFTIDETNEIIKLGGDPNSFWGEDFFGFWASPFPYDVANNKVEYTIGINDFTYTFDFSNDGTVKVEKVWVQEPYNSDGEETVTESTPGTYKLQ